MNNYKIRVNNEAESREAQELLFCLGCEWPNGREFSANHNKGQNAIGFFEDKETCLVWVYPDTSPRFQELTLPQLRDLVVLHRNDYTDATHVDQDGWKWFISSDNNSYVFGAGNSQGLPRWVESTLDHVDLTPMQKPQKIQEQGLISGTDALRALADGEEIQWISKDFKKWNNLDEWNANLKTFLNEKYIAESEFKFRLKPRTIKLEIEIPAPFEPKVGEEYYYPYPHSERGYALDVFKGGRITNQFGAWRTEAEIKIVVEQLHKLKEHSK